MSSPTSPLRMPSIVGGAPLDYSFKDLKSLSDIETEQPRRDRPQVPISPESPNNDAFKHHTLKPTFKVVRITQSANLSNNHIENISNLGPSLSFRIPNVYTNLSFIDLSFNQITSFAGVFSSFPNLLSIYLHSNKLTDINEVLELQSLPRLKNLTLMNNPLQTHSLPRVSKYPEIFKEEQIEIFKKKHPDQPLPSHLLHSRGSAHDNHPVGNTEHDVSGGGSTLTSMSNNKSPSKSMTAHKEAAKRAALVIASQKREYTTYCNYRLFILGSIPSLRSLDFTGITLEDSELAGVWMKEYLMVEMAWDAQEERRRLKADEDGAAY